MDKIYEINDLKKAIFKKRINKYLAEIEIDGKIYAAHIHDPGQLNELLYEENIVEVKYVCSVTRKTNWDIISAKKNNNMVLINSMYHNNIARYILEKRYISELCNVKNLKSEIKYNDSRFDFKGEIENKNIWIEIKGCTLEENNIAMFPDAPTKRGRKHLEELIKIKENNEGEGVIIFLIFVPAEKFRPRYETDKKFSYIFYKALDIGIKIYPVSLIYKEGIVFYNKIINILSE